MSDSSSTSRQPSTSTSHPPTNSSPSSTSSDNHPLKISNIKLNGDNFHQWHLSVQMYIRGRGKIGYLTGEKTEPDITSEEHAVWDAENSMVMAWLVNSMEEEISTNYLGYATAKEMWDSLKQMYSDLGNQSQIYEIQLKIGETKQGTESVTKYFTSLKRLWQDLDMFYDNKWKDPVDGVYFQKITENNRVFKFLAGLNVEFDEVRGRIIGRQPLPILNDVFAEVRREESRRSVMLGKKGSESQPTESSALISQDITVCKVQNRKNEEKTKVWCDHCNKPRHTRETCWKLHGKPANWRPKDKSAHAAVHSASQQFFLNKEQVDQLLKLIPSNSGKDSPKNRRFSCPFR